MNFQLDPQSKAIITAQLDSGHFASAEAVIKESLRLLEIREKKRQELRDKVEKSIQRGGSNTPEEVLQSVTERLKASFS